MRKILAASTLVALTLGIFIVHEIVLEPPPSRAVAPQPDKVYGEWRIRVKPDRGAEYSSLIEQKGLVLFREAGGRMVGWWTTLIGDLYEQVTIWEFDGMPGFEKAGGFLGKDERFKKFVDLRDPLLSGEVSRFLKLAGPAVKPALGEGAKVVVHEVQRVPFSKWSAYWQAMEQALPALEKRGFRHAGPFQTTVGRSTEVTYLWLHESLAERDALLAALRGTGEGLAVERLLLEFVDEATTRVLLPAPFAR